MSEDCRYSGDEDEPLFARRVEGGPGATIYTCPKCGGPREDGKRCVRCVYRSIETLCMTKNDIQIGGQYLRLAGLTVHADALEALTGG